MSDTLAGLTRRIRAFAYERATESEITFLVQESAVHGLDAADAILELALGEADVSWSYGSAAPDGQGPLVGRPMAAAAEEVEDERADDGDEDFLDLSVYDMAGLVSPSLSGSEPADDVWGTGAEDDEEEESFDIDELEAELAECAEGLDGETAPAAPRAEPGEAEMY
jgi:hypothetical protein